MSSVVSFTPVIPSHWKHVIGAVPILPDENRTWDEDIYSAEWRPDESMKPGDGWWIWLDGGKGMSIWQCSLVLPNPVNEDGGIDYRHERLMRDFVETVEEVQSWINRAVVIAEKCQEDDRRSQEETDKG